LKKIDIAMNEYFNPDIKILNIEFQALGKYWNMPDLSAPYWRFYWNESEGAVAWFHKKGCPLLPDEITLIPPNTSFSAACKGTPRQFYVHFTAGPPFDAIAPQIMTIAPGEELLRQIKLTAKTIEEGKADPVKLSMEVIMFILYGLSKIPERFIMHRQTDPRISRAMKMIDDNLAEPPSNTSIASALCMSTNAFLRLFKQNTGVSPQLYSRNRRIDKACILLHYSDLDIKQIAAETGFCDRFHFSRAFRKLRDCGPAEFRKMLS